MKTKLTGLIILILISACNNSTNQESMKEKEITINGTAHNGKGGALIITDNNETYYIGGLEFWEDSILEKTVEVSGFIQTENFKEEDLKDETGAWKQGMIGEKLSILKAKWKLSD